MDTDLVVRSQRGDDAAFGELTQVVGPRLFSLAVSILRDRTLAEDATQRALLQIWRKLPRLRDPRKFGSWSYKLLVHACYAEAKKRPRWIPDDAIPPNREPATSGEYGVVVDREQLERGFSHLSVDHRAVIALHHLLDLTLEETAEALGIPVGTARSRLYYAMQGLRAALEADERSTLLSLDPSREATR